MIVIADPWNERAFDELRERTKRKEVQCYTATASDMERFIEDFYQTGRKGEAGAEGRLASLYSKWESTAEKKTDKEIMEELRSETGSNPVIQTVDLILSQAVRENATDIHINRVEDGMLVLYRVDGLNHEKKNLTEAEGRKLINQIKTAAGLNSVKSFVPQEAQLKFPDDLLQRDIRVTIVPTGKNSESAHLRILSFPQEA